MFPHWLAPVDDQEIWAAGVTYERSRAARQEEAQDGGDIYARVYHAERPELFFKAQGAKVIGPFAAVGIRKDATWNVPEPELAMVMNPAMEVVGFTVGNDMSSRDIEGANPLYLPQAKVIKPPARWGRGLCCKPPLNGLKRPFGFRIQRNPNPTDSSEGTQILDLPNWPVLFSGDIHTDRIKRSLAELAQYLGRSMEFTEGVVLLTGTGIVPPSDFTLQEGDVVEIEIDGIGQLTNMVRVV